MDRTLLDRYAAGPDLLDQAVVGLTPEHLDAFPVAGTWSIRQIVIHLMDSDLIGTYRMKSIIAHDEPQIQPYDQDLFVSRLCYEKQDVGAACRAFRANRQAMTGVLRLLPDIAFDRAGYHEETGRVTLESQVQLYVVHLNHHLQFMSRKRRLLMSE